MSKIEKETLSAFGSSPVMGSIGKMLEELCPNGVEMVNIGDICYITDYVSNGSFATLKQNVQYLSSPNYAVLLRFADYSNGFDESKFVFIDEHAYNFLEKSKLEGGEIIISNVGSCGQLFKCPKLKYKMSLAPNTIMVKSEYQDYLFYWLQSEEGQKAMLKFVSPGAMPKFNKTQFKSIQIPLPPLDVQKEIVRILDKFSAMVENLDKELELRQKQYEYYREKLLTPSDSPEGGEWELKTLGDIGEIKMCKRIMKSQTSADGDIPFFKIGTFGKNPDAFISRELFEEYKNKYNYPEIGDILISAAGTIGRTVVFDGSPSYFQDSNIVWIRNNEELVLNGFLRYFYSVANWEIDNGGVVSRLYNDNIRKTEIPVPPLARQHEIVAILDKFEAMIANIKAEKALRQKQYEYYREKLLTF